MGEKFYQGKMNLPRQRRISLSRPALPYVLVADEAFQLTPFLMRPFPGRNIEQSLSIFNYRLSRARRVIENSFGILAAKWRIYGRPITASLETIESIILATVCLHSFLKKGDNNLPSVGRLYCPPNFVDREDEEGNILYGTWRQQITTLPSIGNAGSNSHSQSAAAIRNTFKEYFVSEGAVPWQWKRN